MRSFLKNELARFIAPTKRSHKISKQLGARKPHADHKALAQTRDVIAPLPRHDLVGLVALQQVALLHAEAILLVQWVRGGRLQVRRVLLQQTDLNPALPPPAPSRL